MQIFNLYVPIPLLVAILVAIAAIYVFWPRLRARQPTRAASATDPGPEGETGIVVPPTLPKVFGPYVLGLVISFAVGVIFIVIGYMVLLLVSPGTFATGGARHFVTFVLLATGAVFFAAVIFALGFGMTPVPVGFAGVPLFFKARPWVWARFLLPEGVQWGLPYLLDYIKIDMRARPLVFDKKNPENDTFVVDALAKVIPPDVTTPANDGQSDTIKNINKVFEVPVQVHIAARIRTFNPYRRLNFQNPDGLLLSNLRERVREFVRGEKNDKKDAFDLPDLKEEMTKRLIDQMEKAGEPMGSNFVKLFVTKIELPELISKEGEKMLIELIQRGKEKFQAETLGQTTAILKKLYPNLSDKELKNMVLTAAGLATTTAYSFEGEGKGPLPVVPLGDGKHGDSHGKDHH